MQNPAVSIWVGKRKSCHLTLSFHKSKPYQKGQFLNWQLKWGSAERTFEVFVYIWPICCYSLSLVQLYHVIWGTNSIGQFKKNFFQEEFVFQKEDCFFQKEDFFLRKIYRGLWILESVVSSRSISVRWQCELFLKSRNKFALEGMQIVEHTKFFPYLQKKNIIFFSAKM